MEKQGTVPTPFYEVSIRTCRRMDRDIVYSFNGMLEINGSE